MKNNAASIGYLQYYSTKMVVMKFKIKNVAVIMQMLLQLYKCWEQDSQICC